ncbi:TetR family transcriptional regulator [Halopolyspora algeriensis]|uniref:TetR family transcriptional regulator n=1 Tax=Halopolyspora algeriensis TaxID=1500506 RepID=A0A368VWB2_9ACTN|nr:TetR family transcriptional regulator [Halopolyspora algeriensis]RCW46139.1 TetR family transcriptional regulator [Halopolyspora algeriensis]TQM55542.1 TetR family transcriptional regulator [Halopolyspora algeriensis]
MSEAAAPAPKPRAGRTATGRRRLRSALAVAALELFASQGYEATTVEDIVDAVGVGRRTFFRYFRSKEEVVFPDHDERLAEVVARLEAADPAEPPLAVVGATAEMVLEMYLAEPEISLKRFELTRAVPSLRDKEIASIDRYQRVFARYLRGRYCGEPHGDLRAAVGASAVVATHNHILRQWLKSAGSLDARAQLREALRLATASVHSPWGEQPAGSESAADERVVVGVVRTAASAETVRARVTGALAELSDDQ